MLRVLSFCLLMSSTILVADEPPALKLAAPEDWGGETIALPPSFAPDMKLKGFEHIRFAPGMMKSESDTFFSYAFVFELEPKPELTEAVIKDEFLKYYRGLCKAVLDGKSPSVDPSEFTIQLKPAKSDATLTNDDKPVSERSHYIGTLKWVEPFATQQPQTLNLEIQTWAKNDRRFIFVCVSPQAKDSAVWKQLHKIRNDYLKK